MKKLSILLLALGLSLNTFAQPRERMEDLTPQERAEKMTERMVEKLDLTDYQKEIIYEANLILAQTERENKDEMKAAIEKHDAELKANLTEEQYTKFKEMREEHRQRRRQRR